MPRKSKTFKLDERVLNALERLARRENASVNRYLENQLFSLAKQEGEIAVDEVPLGETRGGYRKLKTEKDSSAESEAN